MTIRDRRIHWELLPRHFLPTEMDEGFKRREIVGVLFLRPDPEIDFHSSWIGFPSGQRPLHRIAHLMGFGSRDRSMTMKWAS